jgi:hypothetical protein
VLEDLHVFVRDYVAEDVGLVPASPGAVPCLYEAALPAHLSECVQRSGENSSAARGFPTAAPEKER